MRSEEVEPVGEAEFRQLRAAVFDLYAQGRHGEALALATEEARRFPQYANSLYFWRICLTCLAHGADAALDAFHAAVEAGFWLPAEMLHTQPDLATLQGDSEFEELVAACQARTEVARAKVVPWELTLPPKELPRSPRLLVALHGNNSNVRQSKEYWEPANDLAWTVILPQSTQLTGPDVAVWNDRPRAVAEISRHLSEFRAAHASEAVPALAAGFDLGGGLAIWLTLAEALDLEGFIAVAPSLPDLGELAQRLVERPPRGVRGYIVAGAKDTKCLEGSRRVVALMHERGLACELVVVPGLAHDFPPGFTQTLHQALHFVAAERQA